MRIRTFLSFLLMTSTSSVWAHGHGVHAHTHDSGLLAGLAEMLFTASPWTYAIGIIAVAALLHAIWKTY